MSMSIYYTVDDCLVLMNLFDNSDIFSFYLNVIDRAKKENLNRILKKEEINKFICDWLHCDTVDYKKDGDKIIDFLFKTELNKIPLYINDTNLKMFAEWRLRINK